MLRAFIFLVLLALQWPVPADAQNPLRFREMDTNNDGRVTRDEWRGSDQSFRVHDWNRDGVLSGLELRQGTQRNRRLDELDPNVDEFEIWSEEGFLTLDHNRDGRISSNEWHYDTQSFFRADRNRDGWLNRSEFLGAGVEDDRDDRFEYLDTNNDGRVDRSEWHGSPEIFEWLDRNNNGVLNRTEVAGSGDTVALGDRFANLDYNRNGVIGRDEWHWSRAHFDRLDADRDGQISRGEYRGFGEDVGNRDVGNRMVQVNSTQRWTDTGLDVRAGNTIRFQADGTIQLSDNPSDTAGPAGAHSGRRAPNAPVLQAPAGGLIVRIGNSEPIFVGANGTIGRAPANGRLYLGVNDDHLPDNSGQYRVTVDIER